MLKAEKTIVLALLIQVFIAAFSSFLVVGLVSLYDPGSVQGYQVDVALSGSEAEASELLAVANSQPGVRPIPYGSREAALAAFQEGDVEAVLVAQRRDGRTFVRATVPDSNIETTVTVVQVREVLRSFERAERTERASSLRRVPLDLPPEGTSSPYFGFTYTVLVPLLLFLPVFISGSLAVDSLTEERDRGTLELLRVAPVSFGDIVDGKLLAAAGLAPTQAALWIALLRLNGTSVSHPLLLVAFVASLAVLVVSLALALAIVAPDRRATRHRQRRPDERCRRRNGRRRRCRGVPRTPVADATGRPRDPLVSPGVSGTHTRAGVTRSGMGIGGTAKKLQKVAEMGEELYKRINDLRAQVAEMRETVTATHNRVDRLEKEVAEQRAILQALAEREGIDVDALIAEAHISEAESGVTADAGGEASPDADAGGASDDTSAGAADADDATDEPSGSDSTSDSESTRDST